MTTMRSEGEIKGALSLLTNGETPTDVARMMGIPRSTVRDWSYGRIPKCRAQCSLCREDFSEFDESAFAYLLGIYLGDGCISSRARKVWRLRITLDAAYPGIVTECCSAIKAILPDRSAGVYRR